MTGSEKQIKWAESIKADAIVTCERNIKHMEDLIQNHGGGADWEARKARWEEILAALHEAFEDQRAQAAGKIIDNRWMFSPGRLINLVDYPKKPIIFWHSSAADAE